MRTKGLLIRSAAAVGLCFASINGATAQVADPDLYSACLQSCYESAPLATGYSPGVAMQRCTTACTARYDSDGQGSGGSGGVSGVPVRSCYVTRDCINVGGKPL